MKIEVDFEMCASTGQCAHIAPKVFRLNRGMLSYEAEPGEALREDVEDAAESCPLQAITVLG